MSLPGVGEWSVILQKYMKKDNNLLFFFKLFFKRMVYRLEENKENSRIERDRELMALLLNEGRLKK